MQATQGPAIREAAGRNGRPVELALAVKRMGHPLIREAGVEPPVYRSANVDGADEHNARLEARYQVRR